MAINAFRDGVTVLNQTILNELLAQQDFTLIWEGTSIDSESGAGTTENDVATNYYAIRFTATAVTTMMRAEIEAAYDGTGQDMTITVLDSDFNPDGSAEGTILKTVTIPKEHLPASAGTVYIPLNLIGLSVGANYWLKVNKVGDSTNHFHLVGEASADAAHPVYRRTGTSGAWTSSNSIHFAVYTGQNADDELVHGIYGTSLIETYIYAAGGDLSQVYRYCPPYGEVAGGIRDILTVTISNDFLLSGAVT
jgi:hypothetical protein